MATVYFAAMSSTQTSTVHDSDNGLGFKKAFQRTQSKRFEAGGRLLGDVTERAVGGIDVDELRRRQVLCAMTLEPCETAKTSQRTLADRR